MASHKPIISRAHPLVGTQDIYRFANGYGASVVFFSGSYGFKDGKKELAVLKFEGEEYHLTYDTPITDDVIGYLDESEIEQLLTRISELPSEAK